MKRTFVPPLLFPWVCISEREMLLWEKLLGEVGFLNFFGVGRNTYIYVCFQSLGENSGSVCCRERKVGVFFQ